jgi:uncharacterized lipoprotein YmbA
MKPAALSRIAGLLPGLLVLILAGCSIGQRSPETRHYVLALPSDSGRISGPRAITGPRVDIGPISLPAYLDREQIFIRQGGSTNVKLAEYDQWAESMSEGISRLLAEAVSVRLAGSGGAAQPLRAAGSPDWRLGVNVNRFDGAPGASVVLDADWGLYTQQGDILREGHVLDTAPAGSDIESLVRAHGELLARFGDVLAEAVLTNAVPGAGRAAPSKKPVRR